MSRTYRRHDRPRPLRSVSPEVLWAVHHDRPEELAVEVSRAALDPLVIVALEQRCMPVPGAVFLDPLTRACIAYHADECDRRGHDLVCVDEWGIRVGTPRAALVLDESGRYFVVAGVLCGQDFSGYVSAMSDSDAAVWAERLGALVVRVDPLALRGGELEED